jgi:flagellar basal body-associated protein FliL
MDQINLKVQSENTLPSQPRKSVKGFFIFLLILVLFAALGYFGYYWWTMKKELRQMQTTEGIKELQKKQSQELINRLKVHVAVPTDEEPVIATVTDAAALKKQSKFYEMAQNGNNVIIYFKAKKAYLYDSAKDRLLNVGPITLQDQTTSSPTK